MIPHPIRQAVFGLRTQGVGPREIARRLNISPNAVAGLLHRARMTTEAKGRGSASLTAEIQAQIRRRHANGETGRELARDYGVDTTTISAIVRRTDGWASK